MVGANAAKGDRLLAASYGFKKLLGAKDSIIAAEVLDFNVTGLGKAVPYSFG